MISALPFGASALPSSLKRTTDVFEPTALEFEAVRNEFQLSDLAVEDAINAHQRPKLEIYGDTVFAVPSHQVPAVQFADLAAYTVNRWYHVLARNPNALASPQRPA